MPKAMIFAAGLGTRLRPHTDDRPKALVEVGGIPLLDLQLRRLAAQGFTDVVVNVHHFADMVESHLRAREWGVRIHISDERDLLRDTGGGLLHARALLQGDEPIYLCNVDVLSNLDVHALLSLHERSGALATLSLRERATDRYLLFDGDMRLCGWENARTGEVKGRKPADARALAFSGQHVISPSLLDMMRHTGVFSIIDTYLDLAAGGRILGHLDTSSIWMDVGKPAELERGAQLVGEL